MTVQTSITDARDVGAIPFQRVSTADTNAASVKAAPGIITSIIASNVNADERYLKLYDKASAPTVGTDTPKHTIIIPGNAAGGVVAIALVTPLRFELGIAMALTVEATVAGTTGVAASEIVVNLGYS